MATLSKKKQTRKTLYAFLYRKSGEMFKKPVPCWAVITAAHTHPTPQGYTYVKMLMTTHSEDTVEKELETKVRTEVSRMVPTMSVTFTHPPTVSGD